MNSHAVYFLYLCKKIVSHGILQDNHRYNYCPLNKHDLEQTIENLITIIHKAWSGVRRDRVLLLCKNS
ncbi:MAG: hypothetical protein IKT76_02575, partial [Bacteroides sp.]|nr:hypothetical protein [Bacteroides sp.]